MNDFSNGMDHGGYMADHSGEGTGQRRNFGEQSMYPITLKRMKDFTVLQDNVFQLGGVNITLITFVGVIRNTQQLSTNISYTIEDGTGSVEVRQWLSDTSPKDENLVDGTYVRVIGRLNSFNGRLNCVSQSIRPIKDFNEISYHFLDAVLVYQRGKMPAAMNIDTSASSGMASHGMGSVNDQVLNEIKKHGHHNEGVNIHEVIHQLRVSLSESDIRQAVGYLIDEGHCYTTIDDDHVKST